MKINDQQIGEILLGHDYLSKEDFDKAEKYCTENKSSLLDYLFRSQLINKDLLGQALAEFFKLPYADLNTSMPELALTLKIPEELARKKRFALLKETEKEIFVTTDDPGSVTGPEIQTLFPNKKINIFFSLPEDIENIFSRYRKSLETRFAKIIKQSQKVAPEVLNEIFEDALSFRASDIHFEPRDKEVVIRFRVDGLLREAGRIPKEYYENILNRIKVEAHIRIDEHFSAQDGASRYVSRDNKTITDMRVSIIPNLDGEKVVMRLLSSYVRRFTLNDLGLSEDGRQALIRAGRKPFGMILVTGPTGSGKTTTLYALLKILSNPEINVMTIEDPVEYRMEDINQIQVNNQTNLTFAHGLRSIVRQDPDIILVGEIRDEETVEIAVNAALTGHLLLSTFHANDAASSIPRLLDMKVEPFLLASTLELIIAQRLVRKICESCRYSYAESAENLKKVFPEVETFFGSGEVTLYRGKGCSHCNNTGFKDRTAIFELISVSQELKDLILENPSSREIWFEARKSGARTLFEDGIEKIKNGVTTIDELLRVATPPSIYEREEKGSQKTKKKII